MTLAPSTTIRQSERIASRVIDGKAVVIVLDAHRLHTLNEVGTRVWELADGRSIASIAEALAADFEVDRDTALADTARFVQELRALGAIEVDEPERAQP
ncbi:MAG: PqqD family protein [Deltaproteobacteria bacterium]|nr:PqqD family protein [Deltaproteobacteria bacterium]